MAGFWNQSFQTIQDVNGKPIVGARAFFYAGGTTTPITVYQDYGQTTPHPNPLNTDGYGRFPAVYLDEDDEFFRFRLTTPGGVVIVDADQIPIIGPTEGGGGAPPAPVDPDAVLTTGDLKARYGEGFESGYVRGNGRTIGSATSGATERANSDAQPLFEFLWNVDATLVVLGGRGGSASADWAANKQITLPDFRGRAIVGHDIMGNIAAGVLNGATTLGWKGGAQTVTLTTAMIPAHGHVITVADAGAHTHGVLRGSTGGGNAAQTGGVSGGEFSTESSGVHKHVASATQTGGGSAHANVQPSIAITVYIRL